MWEGHPCPDTVKVLLTTCPDLSGCSERNGGTEGRVGGASPDIVGLFQSLQRRGCSINRHLPPWSQHGRYAHPRQLIPFLNNGVASSFVTTKLSGSKCLTRLPAPPLPHFPTFPPSHFLTFPLPRLLTSGERTFRQLPPHHGRHLKMHNFMIPNFQLHRAEPVRPPELLNLFDDCIPKISILHRALSQNKNPEQSSIHSDLSE